MTYDPVMAYMPTFVSWPRSGSHWINCVAELYFNRPRLRFGSTTFLPRSRQDFMWIHDHDLDTSLPMTRTLYLYRNPVHVIYSQAHLITEKSGFSNGLLHHQKGSVEHVKVNPVFIDEVCKGLKRHFNKYFNEKHVLIKYENFVADFDKEFEKVVRFFGKMPVDQTRLDEAKSQVTKESLAKISPDKTWMGYHLLTDEYKQSREDFTREWSEYILNKIDNERIRQEYDKED